MRLTLFVASLAFAGSALAGNPQAPAHPPGYAMDANQDGFVSREEAQSFPRLAGSFDAWDKNQDGQLDQAEMTAHREAMRGEMRARAQERWKAADKDGSGGLSREEAQASMPGLAARFDELDTDKDGQVSANEMHGFRMAGPKAERKDMRQRFKAADTDGDGALDLAEAQTGLPWLAERFASVDANNDGKVTRDECRAARKRASSEQL